MAYKGLVMETTNDYIIVLTDDSKYVKLKKKGDIDIGKKIMFIDEDIVKNKNNYYTPLLGIAAAIILLITTIFGQFGFNIMGNFETYAIVSLDINPSIEFKIDKKKIVRDIKSLNEDGVDLIDDNMIGMKIEDAIVFSIKTALNKQYLDNENKVILVSDVIMDEKIKHSTLIEDNIFEKVEEEKDLENINVIYIDSDKDDLEKARKNQVSVGKYKVYEIVSEDNPDVKIEDIKEKKVSEIVKENKELTEKENVKTKKNNNKKESDKSDKENKKIKKANKKKRKLEKKMKAKAEREKKKKNKKQDKENKKENKSNVQEKKSNKKEEVKKNNNKKINNNTKERKDRNKKTNEKIKEIREKIKAAREKKKNAKNINEKDKKDRANNKAKGKENDD